MKQNEKLNQLVKDLEIKIEQITKKIPNIIDDIDNINKLS